MSGSRNNVYSLKYLATTSLCLLVAVLSVTPLTNAQFFTKTSKSVPRMGRRSDPRASIPSENGPLFSQALHLVRHFDSDGDGSLSPEELSMVPLLRLAFSSPPSVNQEQRQNLDNLRKQMNALLNGEKGLTSALDDPLEWDKKRR